MLIKSYLIHPHLGKKAKVTDILARMKECTILPAENQDILALVTETKDEKADVELKDKLDQLKEIKLLVMVSGFTHEEPNFKKEPNFKNQLSK